MRPWWIWPLLCVLPALAMYDIVMAIRKKRQGAPHALLYILLLSAASALVIGGLLIWAVLK